MIIKSILAVIGFIDRVISLINHIVEKTTFLKKSAVYIWENHIIRKWVYGCLNIVDFIVSWIKNYLVGIRAVLKYRFYYQNVALSMKNQYRALKQK
jgi:hypothetical protein